MRIAVALLMGFAVNAGLLALLSYLNERSLVLAADVQSPKSRCAVMRRVAEPRRDRAQQERTAAALPEPQVTVDLDLPTPELPTIDLPDMSPSLTVPPPLLRLTPQAPVRVKVATTGESGGGATGPLAMNAVDEPPRELSAPQPPYPGRAKRRGTEGEVTVRFLIDARGGVDTIEVVSSSGGYEFVRSVKKAVARWRFTPARHRGKPVPVIGVKTIHFQLERRR